MYTQTDLLDPAPGAEEETVDERLARSREAQQARQREREKHLSGADAASVELPRERPMIGGDGTDSFGYPLALPDRIGLLALLRAERYDDLTRYMNEYQEAAEADFRNEHGPIWANGTFAMADERLTPLLRRWIEHSPDSFAPYLARGSHLSAMAWKVRGGKTVDKTESDRMERFGSMLLLANTDLERAIELRPTAVAAYLKLLGNACSGGAPLEEQAKIRDAALRQCPNCYMPHRVFMVGLKPRWGGSYAAMDAYAKEQQRRVGENPKLRVLLGFAALDRCDAQMIAKNFAAAREECDAAVAVAPNYPVFLLQRAQVAIRDKRYAQAVEDLDIVLEQWPQETAARVARAKALMYQRRYEDAIPDMLVARRSNPVDSKAKTWTAEVLKWVRSEAVRSFDEGDYARSQEVLEMGLELDPEAQDLHGQLGRVRAKLGTGTIEALAEANPDDFNALRDKDHALAAQGRYDEILPMWDDYLSRHPKDGRAYFERGGTHHHLGHEEKARADIERGCSLGVKQACQIAKRWRGR